MLLTPLTLKLHTFDFYDTEWARLSVFLLTPSSVSIRGPCSLYFLLSAASPGSAVVPSQSRLGIRYSSWVVTWGQYHLYTDDSQICFL